MQLQIFDEVIFSPNDDINSFYGELATEYKLHSVVGKKGVVLGYTPIDDSKANDCFEKSLDFAVDFPGLPGLITVPKTHLVKTGKKAKQEDFYDGSSLTVSVDPETGEGTITNIDIKDDNND